VSELELRTAHFRFLPEASESAPRVACSVCQYSSANNFLAWNDVPDSVHPENDAQVAAHLETKRPVLGICLKRYSMTNEGVGSRLDTYIDIPLEMGLPHFISDESGSNDGFAPNFTNFKLSLQSVICHRGKSLGAGHYISLVRNEVPGSSSMPRRARSPANPWLRFDDLAKDRIAPVDIHQALKDECPYLLFYQVQPIDDDDEDYDPEDRGKPPTYDEATVNSNHTGTSLTPTESVTTDATAATNSSSILPEPARSSRPSMLDIGLAAAQDRTTDSVDTSGIPNSVAQIRPPLAKIPTSKSLPSMLDVGLAAQTEERISKNEITDTVKTNDAIPNLLTKSPTLPTSTNSELPIHIEPSRPKSIVMAGLDQDTTRKSLDIPRGRTSFQSSDRRSSIAFTDNESSFKGGSSAPITPGDETEAKSSYLSASRRNSISKTWRRSKSSRPTSQSGENRLSLGNRLKGAMSKDKLLSSTLPGIAADDPPAPNASPEKGKFGSVRRTKSKKHASHRKSQLEKKVDIVAEAAGDGKGGLNGEGKPDRQCLIM
jgi:hypothetical protein